MDIKSFFLPGLHKRKVLSRERIPCLVLLFLCSLSSALAEIPNPVKNSSDLNEPEREEVLGMDEIEVLTADYGLIQQDFPETKGMTHGQIDQWLKKSAGYIAAAQTKQTTVNTSIKTNGKKINALRPLTYNRALVIPVESGGFIDMKGAGSQNPRQKSHGNGLATAYESFREFLMEKKVQQVLKDAGSKYRTVGCYAVFRFGFEVIHNDGTRSPAGAVLRQAHKRMPSEEIIKKGNTFLPDDQALEIEMLLRKYGITSSGEADWGFEGKQSFDIMNVQGNQNGEILDFGAFRIRSSFTKDVNFYPPPGFENGKEAVKFGAPNFVQVDPAVAITEEDWGRPAESSLPLKKELLTEKIRKVIDKFPYAKGNRSELEKFYWQFMSDGGYPEAKQFQIHHGVQDARLDVREFLGVTELSTTQIERLTRAVDENDTRAIQRIPALLAKIKRPSLDSPQINKLLIHILTSKDEVALSRICEQLFPLLGETSINSLFSVLWNIGSPKSEELLIRYFFSRPESILKFPELQKRMENSPNALLNMAKYVLPKKHAKSLTPVMNHLFDRGVDFFSEMVKTVMAAPPNLEWFEEKFWPQDRLIKMVPDLDADTTDALIKNVLSRRGFSVKPELLEVLLAHGKSFSHRGRIYESIAKTLFAKPGFVIENQNLVRRFAGAADSPNLRSVLISTIFSKTIPTGFEDLLPRLVLDGSDEDLAVLLKAIAEKHSESLLPSLRLIAYKLKTEQLPLLGEAISFFSKDSKTIQVLGEAMKIAAVPERRDFLFAKFAAENHSTADKLRNVLHLGWLATVLPSKLIGPGKQSGTPASRQELRENFKVRMEMLNPKHFYDLGLPRFNAGVSATTTALKEAYGLAALKASEDSPFDLGEATHNSLGITFLDFAKSNHMSQQTLIKFWMSDQRNPVSIATELLSTRGASTDYRSAKRLLEDYLFNVNNLIPKMEDKLSLDSLLADVMKLEISKAAKAHRMLSLAEVFPATNALLDLLLIREGTETPSARKVFLKLPGIIRSIRGLNYSDNASKAIIRRINETIHLIGELGLEDQEVYLQTASICDRFFSKVSH